MTFIRTTQAIPNPSVIDFGIGQPQPELLPHRLIQQAAEKRLAEPDPSLLAYGPPEGDGYFLRALAEFLTARYGFSVSWEQLVVSAGNSQAIDLVSTLFAQAGDTIFVEEPSYFLALQIFADHRFKLVSLPMDEHGLIPEAVESALQAHQPAFLYTVPTFHNPTSTTLSQKRREQLIALAQSHDFLIVADEVYQLLDYTAAPPPPFAAYSESGHVLSLGSFSKIFAPGLRLGWLHTAPDLRQRIIDSGLLDSGGSINHFTASVMRVALTEGLQAQYLMTLKQTYTERAQAMSAALHTHLPQLSFHEPQGGFFIWLALPNGVDAKSLQTEAEQLGVSFQPGINFSSQQGLRHWIRLCFTFYDVAAIEEGVARLARAVTLSG